MRRAKLTRVASRSRKTCGSAAPSSLLPGLATERTADPLRTGRRPAGLAADLITPRTCGREAIPAARAMAGDTRLVLVEKPAASLSHTETGGIDWFIGRLTNEETRSCSLSTICSWAMGLEAKRRAKRSPVTGLRSGRADAQDLRVTAADLGAAQQALHSSSLLRSRFAGQFSKLQLCANITAEHNLPYVKSSHARFSERSLPSKVTFASQGC